MVASVAIPAWAIVVTIVLVALLIGALAVVVFRAWSERKRLRPDDHLGRYERGIAQGDEPKAQLLARQINEAAIQMNSLTRLHNDAVIEFNGLVIGGAPQATIDAKKAEVDGLAKSLRAATSLVDSLRFQGRNMYPDFFPR